MKTLYADRYPRRQAASFVALQNSLRTAYADTRDATYGCSARVIRAEFARHCSAILSLHATRYLTLQQEAKLAELASSYLYLLLDD
jgi:hypothetical protein